MRPGSQMYCIKLYGLVLQRFFGASQSHVDDFAKYI